MVDKFGVLEGGWCSIKGNGLMGYGLCHAIKKGYDFFFLFA